MFCKDHIAIDKARAVKVKFGSAGRTACRCNIVEDG